MDQPSGGDRITRNWEDILQELRVLETGVQILTGFLLTVPFSQRFQQLTDFQRALYLGVLGGAVTTTALVLAPVAFHRVLFRQHARPWLVAAANWSARAGLLMTALTMSGALFLIFDIVAGVGFGVTAFLVGLFCLTALWLAVPLGARGHDGVGTWQPGERTR